MSRQASGFNPSSRWYRWRNSRHLAGSPPNHLQSRVLGAAPTAHISIRAVAIGTPRGHLRSTRILVPSDDEAGSHAHLIAIIGALASLGAC